MATCKKCGAYVGCGCNLTNGLCAICYTNSLNPSRCSHITQNNVSTVTSKTCYS